MYQIIIITNKPTDVERRFRERTQDVVRPDCARKARADEKAKPKSDCTRSFTKEKQ